MIGSHQVCDVWQASASLYVIVEELLTLTIPFQLIPLHLRTIRVIGSLAL